MHNASIATSCVAAANAWISSSRSDQLEVAGQIEQRPVEAVLTVMTDCAVMIQCFNVQRDVRRTSTIGAQANLKVHGMTSTAVSQVIVSIETSSTLSQVGSASQMKPIGAPFTEVQC